MKTKTKIDKQIKNKKNSEIVDTILLAKKQDGWLAVASILSGPKNRYVKVNLNKINKEVKDGDIVVVPGKVLSLGEIEHKIKVVALSFSKQAEKKLKEKKCEISGLIEEIKTNPKAQGVKIVK